VWTGKDSNLQPID